MHLDGCRAVFFLYRRRPGLVQRVVDLRAVIPGFDALHRPGMTVVRTWSGQRRALRAVPTARIGRLLGWWRGGLGSLRPPYMIDSAPWNGPTKASCWGCGGMANPQPSSNS